MKICSLTRVLGRLTVSNGTSAFTPSPIIAPEYLHVKNNNKNLKKKKTFRFKTDGIHFNSLRSFRRRPTDGAPVAYDAEMNQRQLTHPAQQSNTRKDEIHKLKLPSNFTSVTQRHLSTNTPIVKINTTDQ